MAPPASLLLLASLAGTGLSAYTTPIKHVIVLMEENRSFDHMFGFAGKAIPGVTGLTGTESNPIDTCDPSKGSLRVNNTSPYVGPFDPNHSTPATAQKIFGACPKDEKTARMSGFVEYEKAHHADPSSVINMFTPERLPVFTALAQQYAIMDHMFAAHPGPTWPNRLFAITGTSNGCTETGQWYKCEFGTPFPQKTIFDSVQEAGLTWKHYYVDTSFENMMAFYSKPANQPFIQHYSEFLKDVQAGTLPTLSWVDPRMGVDPKTGEGSNDQHPDHDVALGEKLMKEIYEAVRAGPSWNETLLILTYDEHGGFYDHVPTPLDVPAPGDNTPSCPDANFTFTRLGVRVPTVLVSPWIEKGTVIHEPDTAGTHYDLTSLPGTFKNMFGLSSFLTKRDEWSGKFDGYLKKLSAPRTDCPEKLPNPPAQTLMPEVEAALPINELQIHAIRALESLTGVSGAHIKTQGEAGLWLREQTERSLGRSL